MEPTTAPYTTNFADSKETYQAALLSLFAGKPENTEADLAKLFTPTFTQRDDHETRDFQAYVAHIRHMREMKVKVTLGMGPFLRDGSRLAERHMSGTAGPDGFVRRSETFRFCEIAEDGRIQSIVETVAQGKEWRIGEYAQAFGGWVARGRDRALNWAGLTWIEHEK
ncbi:uncharacterized protein DNG_06872 [Cephalotrichum gorgonifer]|uniref:SnoaL-like domain-containing protein n=1 Tax=Cephalotrichum gorgonifer TaxID=2041049 RepID=A0AAE8N2A4_9PEZI|nr:uncharacterized protein DNG_06872 [Cephalotrichum gorgonifer]